MNDLSSILKEVYNTDGVALVPGGGTYGMEAVARQVAVNKHALVIRNGYFSYRWSQIFESGNFNKKTQSSKQTIEMKRHLLSRLLQLMKL